MTTYLRSRRYPAYLLVVAACLIGCLAAKTASAKIDVKDKVVLANLGKYPVHFRVGSTRKQIASKKASVLSPKRFPVSVEYFNGVKGRPAWEKLTVSEAGVYTFRWQRGRWTAVKLQPKKKRTTTTTRRYTPSRTVRRSVGSRPRVVRSGAAYRPVRRYGPRYPLLARVGRGVLGLYRFVRDEEDRDLLRRLVVDGAIDDAIRDEIIDNFDKLAVNLPADERREFDRALDDLGKLTPDDIKSLEAATDDEWNQVEQGLHDSVDKDLWNNMVDDFSNVDLDELSDVETADLDNVGIEDLSEDVDLGDLGGDDGEVLIEDLDIGDLGDFGGGLEDIDLGDLDIGDDLDWGGGFDDGGGFDYGGGFDGGGFDDFGGGGFDDFGGGGFDDFGGGGFDDFGGGGFDDFGGGFDF